MTALLSKKIVINGVLTAVILLFTVSLWKAENLLFSVSSLVAILGWVGWWQERATEIDGDDEALPEEEGEASVPASLKANLAKIPFLGSLFNARSGQEKDEATTENSAPVHTSGDSIGELEDQTYRDAAGNLVATTHPSLLEVGQDLGEVVQQIETARVEVEQAVGVAITSFGTLVEQTVLLKECCKEVAGWQDASNPLRQATVIYLVQCSQELETSVNQLVMAFQFNDLLSQRLTHTETSLEHLRGRLRGEKQPEMRHNHSFAKAPVEYAAKSQEEEMITLF